MVCTPIYYFSVLKGPATLRPQKFWDFPQNSVINHSTQLEVSSHPIEAEGYEIHPDFISLVRELNILEPKPQDFEEVDVLNFLELE
jgi:hypothetical protein